MSEYLEGSGPSEVVSDSEAGQSDKRMLRDHMEALKMPWPRFLKEFANYLEDQATLTRVAEDEDQLALQEEESKQLLVARAALQKAADAASRLDGRSLMSSS